MPLVSSMQIKTVDFRNYRNKEHLFKLLTTLGLTEGGWEGSEAAASSAGSPAGRNRGGPGNFILGAPPTGVADRTTALFWGNLVRF